MYQDENTCTHCGSYPFNEESAMRLALTQFIRDEECYFCSVECRRNYISTLEIL